MKAVTAIKMLMATVDATLVERNENVLSFRVANLINVDAALAMADKIEAELGWVIVVLH